MVNKHFPVMYNGCVLWLKLVNGMYKPAKGLGRETVLWKCGLILQASDVEFDLMLPRTV
jgi:hypothetical protein